MVTAQTEQDRTLMANAAYMRVLKAFIAEKWEGWR